MLRFQQREKTIRRRKCPVEAEMNFGEFFSAAFSHHEGPGSLDGSGQFPYHRLNPPEGLFQSLNQGPPSARCKCRQWVLHRPGRPAEL